MVGRGDGNILRRMRAEDELLYAQLMELSEKARNSCQEWIDAHVTQTADNSVLIDIAGLNVVLVDHNDLGADFYDQVKDALLV